MKIRQLRKIQSDPIPLVEVTGDEFLRSGVKKIAFKYRHQKGWEEWLYMDNGKPVENGNAALDAFIASNKDFLIVNNM